MGEAKNIYFTCIKESFHESIPVMESQWKALLSGEVDCVTQKTIESGTKVLLCSLGFVIFHDTARCLLKVFRNKKNNKTWYHRFQATAEKKLILGKLIGSFVRMDVKEKTVAMRNKAAPTSAPNKKLQPSKQSSEHPVPVAVQRQTEVLFFPDSGIPCKDFYSSPTGCPKNDMCQFLHEETAYLRLLRILKAAKKSIDVCVFCLTCMDLGSTLISKSNNDGVRVRVVTDSEQLNVTGSQIGRLRREGVLVRHDASSYLMHHKFAIIDEELLINGSFNWTRTAITGNHENLVISRDENMVKPFVKQFSVLWQLFHPDKQKGFSQKPIRQPW